MNEVNFKNLDFKVTKDPLFTMDGLTTPYFATRRTDNLNVLGCVGASYEVHQNSETVEIIEAIAETLDYQIVTSYCIDGGKRIALQVDTHKDFKVADDVVKRYITAMNSHDGSTNLAFGGTDKVMSCQNQFTRFFKTMSFKTRHSKNMRTRLKSYIDYVQLLNVNIDSQMLEYTQWAGNKITKDLADKVILEVMKFDTTANIDMTQQQYNKFEDIRACIVSEMGQKGQTYWGLFNGFTYYSNHVMNEKQDTETSITKTIFGNAANFNSHAYNIVKEFAY